MEKRKKKLFSRIINKTFNFWEKLGIHITPDHYYSPIPNVSLLNDKLWEKTLDVPGINFNEQEQKELIHLLTKKYKKEINGYLLKELKKENYKIYSREFSIVDSEMLYYMIRNNKPKRIIEIGSGYSTLILYKSIIKNMKEDRNYLCELISIDPYPNRDLLNIIRTNYFKIIPEKVQDVKKSFFQELEEKDFLFIDSSHVLKIGSDVQYEYLEILPIINKKVIIHCHDIFFPSEYPKNWIRDEHRFWNEQYLLQAFLAYNTSFKILWAGSYMHLKNQELLKKNLQTYKKESWPISFYFQRI